MFISNNCASLHLWCKENLIKHQKASKYYENVDIYRHKQTKTMIYKHIIYKQTQTFKRGNCEFPNRISQITMIYTLLF